MILKELLLFCLFISIFLLGMYLLRSGLFNLSGKRMNDALKTVTNKPWKGFLAGTVMTGILQSSTAVTVMTVGLVSAGSMGFQQSIGIILGSNIGTTVTAEFMAFPLEKGIVPGAIIGAILILFSHFHLRSVGFIIFGLSAIFTAIEGFKSLAIPLSSYKYFSTIMEQMDQHLIIALIVGAIITAIIHSSSATIGICMGFLASGDLSVQSSISIMLGANIGTCITAYLASIGAGKEAKLTSYAHIWLNLLGAIIFFPFIGQLEAAAAFLTHEKGVQLAHASVIYNAACSLVMLPFTGLFSRFLVRLHGRK
ncbi:Na/Pi symporter [Peribacillus acanthi]|uniref:Na/Pi symporter n=1 Tax=Peribacillus acanthi TaxID=2171554 RepID=UPI001F0BBEFC|nr:Na/Pi symporter [Peribacillus acanthi]